MRRDGFLRAALLAMPALTLGTVRRDGGEAAVAQDEFDPATSAASQSLRVLLGTGDAQPNPGGGFTFEGRPYRGTFARLPSGEIVNTLPLEEYLYSVVPREMPPSWPRAALQSQAICARTYVLQRSDPRRSYDLVPSEVDQVYNGTLGESPAARGAVDSTASLVLRFAGGYAQIVYSSCCGGRTEASSDAWGGVPFPYLESVACAYCTASPNYRWQRTLDAAGLAKAFASELAPFGTFRGARIADRDGSGRVRTIELAADHGSAFVRGAIFRSRVGSRVVPSLLIERIDGSFDSSPELALQGAGLGHGVGLCQWGSRGYALDGGTARDILSFYFPGTNVARSLSVE
ncbi:MAG: SpoIID/LytB domain-containing protein [Candidatus Eremiobacteraeota bacterium]|nr:SpoIID/LytB domain-containing protein [Candidatus Eremiobacteraeota bacterium]